MTVGKKTRFEVFKRDGFACQYCGRKSPDVLLHVDHLSPVSLGGSDDIVNLITSCIDCNLGKGATPLSDNTALAKQRDQLAALQERREQLDMMLEWQLGLANMDTEIADKVGLLWSELVPGWSLNEKGKKEIQKLIRKHGLPDTCEAMRAAADTYVKFDASGKALSESVHKAWSSVAGICRTRATEKKKPYIRDLFYIRGILRNRLTYLREYEVIDILEQALLVGVGIDDLKRLARICTDWDDWLSTMGRWQREIETERKTEEEAP